MSEERAIEIATELGLELQGRRYPPYVASKAQRLRWALCEEIAHRMFGDLGGGYQWQATRSLYRSEIPIEDLDCS